jgi:hypothetical protein
MAAGLPGWDTFVSDELDASLAVCTLFALVVATVVVVSDANAFKYGLVF